MESQVDGGERLAGSVDADGPGPASGAASGDDPVAGRRFPGMLTLEEIGAIFARDLPRLTDAQLASVLMEILRLGPSPLSGVLEPLTRAELAARRKTARPRETPR